MSLISVILTNDSLENGSTVFHVGDVVSLRSSLTMDKYRPLTINKFITVNEKVEAECVWFDKNLHLCRSIFSLTSLHGELRNGKTFTQSPN